MCAARRYNKGLKSDAPGDVQFLLDHYPEDAVERKREVELNRMIEAEMALKPTCCG
jgi:hypothetical protein